MASRNGGRKVQEKQTGDLIVLGSDSKKLKDQSVDDEMASKVADLKVQDTQTEAPPSLGSASICREQSEGKTEDGLCRGIEDPEGRKEPSEYPLASDSTSGKPKDEAFHEPPQPEQKSGDDDTDSDVTPPSSPECNCDPDSNCELASFRSNIRYKRQLHKSKGYYVDSRLCKGPMWYGTPYPFKMAKLVRSNLFARCILDGVAYAITEHNKKQQTLKLELEKVIYSVESGSWNHRVTFLGKDSSGQTDYYQAHFFYCEFKQCAKNKELFELRREPDRHGASHYLRRRKKDIPEPTARRYSCERGHPGG